MENKSLLFLIVLVILASLSGITYAGDRSPNKHTYQSSPQNIQQSIEDHSVSSISESFEGTVFPPAGWLKLNPDGGSGWIRVTVGTNPIPGWNGGSITTPPGGGSATAFCTWNTGGMNSNDQWLITPQITNIQSGDSLTFYLLKPGYTSQTFADTFMVMISTTTPTQAAFTAIDTIGIAGGSPDTLWRKHSYRISDYVTPGVNVYIAFREKVQDNQNSGAAFQLDLVKVFSAAITSITNLNTGLPDNYSLRQNYPNPFNPTTKIQFNVAPGKNNLAKEVRLIIFNSLGQEIVTPIKGHLQPGSYEYTFDGAKLNSGVYYYRLQAGEFVETKSMILVK